MTTTQISIAITKIWKFTLLFIIFALQPDPKKDLDRMNDQVLKEKG
jgi:hypothetical protein